MFRVPRAASRLQAFSRPARHQTAPAAAPAASTAPAQSFNVVKFEKEDVGMVMTELPAFNFYEIKEPVPNPYKGSTMDTSILLDPPKPALAPPKTQFSKLENGLKIASVDKQGLMAQLGLFVNAGSRFEDSSNFGVSHMVSMMSYNSTAHLSHLRTVKTLEQLGANATSSCKAGREETVYQVEVLREFVPLVVPLMVGNILFPRLVPWEVKAAHKKVKEAKEALTRDADATVSELLHKAAYCNNTLGHSTLASDRSMSYFTPETIRSFMLDHFAPERMVLVGANMKRLYRNLAISGVVGIVAIVAGFFVLRQKKEREVLGKPLLTRLQPKNLVDRESLQPMPTHAWPYRASDVQGTGAVNRTTVKNLTKPAWTFYMDTLIFTTPVMDKAGNIYFAPMSGMIYSLDPNGKTRWKHKLLGTQPPTPAIVDEMLILSDSLGYGYGLNLTTGKVRWVREIANQTGSDSWAVIAEQGLAIFSQSDDEETGTGQLIATDAATGEERWMFSLNTSLHNVAPAFTDNGRALVFADSNAGLYKLDADTGKLLWAVPGYNWTVPEGPTKIYRSLAGGVQVYDGIVYSSGNPTFAAGIARAHRVDTGELVWESKKFKEHVSNSGVVGMIDGVLTFVCGYGFTPPLHLTLPTARKPFISTVVALNALTGEVLWTFKSPKWDEDIAAGQRFMELGVPNIPNSWSAPTITGDGTVYITWMGGVLFALDGRTGKMISSYTTEEGGHAQPVVGHYGELVVACGCHVMLFRPCDDCVEQGFQWLRWFGD